MSEYLRSRARPGDRIEIRGPYGQFQLREVRRPVLMVAGGTGLGLMLSMLDYLVRIGGTVEPITLFYGANTRDDLFGLDRLERLEASGLNLDMRLVVLEPDLGWGRAAGYVTSPLAHVEFRNGGVDAYVCGPPPMIDAANKMLREKGVHEKDLHREGRFSPSS